MSAAAGWERELAKLHKSIDRCPATCMPSTSERFKSQDEGLVDWSPIPARTGSWELLNAAVDGDPGCSAAAGSLVGLALGDAIGAPLEFLPVDPHPVDLDRRSRRPGLIPDADGGSFFQYRKEFNKFKLQRGQWTDDCSMALCLADSLLVHNEYHGGDARVRWHMWWTHGYNNAFRHDAERPRRTSVGLGGNVWNSLADVQRISAHSKDAALVVPAVFSSTGDDAGNGSIMRLAPVPIAFHGDEVQAMEVAALQSKATHPSDDAAACSRFLAFFIARSIASHKQVRRPWRYARRFIDEQIRDFLQIAGKSWKDRGTKLLCGLLRCQPPGPKEANWNWKQELLSIEEALAARRSSSDGTYNGYAVSEAYFGSYCMDGLAMALWALWQSTDFTSCIVRAVNLLGDADTVGAIAGQMAGALYGMRGIMATKWGLHCIDNLALWDPFAEVGLRAAILYQHGPRSGVVIHRGEAHKTVHMFEQPNVGTTLLAEIPSGMKAACVECRKDWALVRHGQVQGWVHLKNVADETDIAKENNSSNVVPDIPGEKSLPNKFSTIQSAHSLLSASRGMIDSNNLPERVVVRQSGGHGTVRIYEKPSSSAEVVRELPNGQQLRCVARKGNWMQVACGTCNGWIGVKNIAEEIYGCTYV